MKHFTQISKFAAIAAIGISLYACEEKAAATAFTDERDGKTYRTVKIGKQTWMAENLNYAAKDSKCYGEGGKVFTGISGVENSEDIGTFNYGTLTNDEIQAYCAKYGRLYNWETAMAACPKGWHLPSNEEWQTLAGFAGDSYTAAKKLMAKSGWEDNDGGTDDYGFAALPGGEHFTVTDGHFRNIGSSGYWWSASGGNNGYARQWSIGLFAEENDETIVTYDQDKSNLYSIRCIKD
jgi:uncharacterized protein (TIGR02145 family)